MDIKILPEVEKTLQKQGPVVALESTLITHGFPYPENLAIARESEAAIRKEGATPATIAIINGTLCVGLLDEGLEALSKPRNDILKATTRDLPLAIAQKRTAGTTVAATMVIAAMAGIKIFATGGIGGVHRGVAETWDISADLTELARTPLAVVCSGAKSLLDLPKTLETLETLGYGTDEFPAFYSRTSGLKIDARVNTPEEAAAILKSHQALGAQNGLLFCNPLSEAEALPADEMEKHIRAGVIEAAKQGISGKTATPFLLKYIVAATGGRTIQPNKALIRANAALAAKIAVAFSKT